MKLQFISGVSTLQGVQ